MHDVVIDELERHLSGSASGAFHAHLAACPECRAEVAEMDSLSALFREFRVDSDLIPEPRLGFYSRVTGEIIQQQRKEAWGLFSPGFAFFRRIAFASLLLLAGLGSYLITSESSFTASNDQDAATIMAQHDPSVDHPDGSDRDRMLVTLANYHE
jgi:anti-sigma factor RsiW